MIPAVIQVGLLNSLLTQRQLTVMLLLFGLFGLSLLWAFGQHFDVWSFLYFNVKGNRPQWLDWLMLLFKPGGYGITAVLLAGFCYLMDQRIRA